MKYRVDFKPSAARAIVDLPEPDQSRVLKRIDALEDNPRPPGYKKVHGTDYFRIRVGDYRVVYSIEDEVLVVLVVRVGHRKEIYRGL